MGICPYCGYSTGVFRKVHRACIMKYERGMKDIQDYGQKLEQTDARKTYRQVKNWALAVFILGYGLLGPAYAVIQKGSFGWIFIKYVSVVLTVGLGAIWCWFDSAENDYPFGKPTFYMLMIAFPVGFIVYIQRSRGWRKGSITLLKAILFWLSSILLFSICAVLTARLLGVPLK